MALEKVNEHNSLPEIEPIGKKMIVTGYNSMIGSRFLELTQNQPTGGDLFRAPSTSPVKILRLDLVKASQNQILKELSGNEGENLVHFAGFTDVDGAELQCGDTEGACWQLNVEATKKLVRAAKKLNLKMVYISTDFVFGGDSGPYAEVDKVAKSADSISWYGWTKLVGENVVREAGINFLTARTSYPYRAKFAAKLDFVRNIAERLKSGNLYPMFTDQFLTPTFIDNFVQALNLLISENQIGIWHVVDDTTLSAYEAACEIARVFGADPAKIQKLSILEFHKENPTAAQRPVKGGLKNDKLRQFLKGAGVDMQDFRQALETMKQQMEAKA